MGPKQGRDETGRSFVVAAVAFAMAASLFGISIIALPIGPSHDQTPDTAHAVGVTTISVDCDASGNLVGTISGIPGPYPVTFDVYVTDHIPGESDFVEIPGSRVTVTATV